MVVESEGTELQTFTHDREPFLGILAHKFVGMDIECPHLSVLSGWQDFPDLEGEVIFAVGIELLEKERQLHIFNLYASLVRLAEVKRCWLLCLIKDLRPCISPQIPL